MRTAQPVLPVANTASEIDPANLLTRARRLDRNALALLHQTYYPEVYRYLCFRLTDESACAEIAAQVFVQFLAALRKRRAPRSNLSGWLLGAAGRLTDERLRKAGKPAAAEKLLPTPGIENERQRFYIALLHLPVDQQHFLALRFSQPRSLGEVARLVDKPEERLRLLQERALTALRNQLEGQA